MTPREALEILDMITAQIQLSREGHMKCIQALQTLAGLVNPVGEPNAQ